MTPKKKKPTKKPAKPAAPVFEPGKTYRMRGGGTANVYEIGNGRLFGVYKCLNGRRCGSWWHMDGSFSPAQNGPTPYDLMSPDAPCPTCGRKMGGA